LVHGDLRPHAGVAALVPGVLEPGVVAELAGHGDRVEDPEPLAAAHVEPAHVALVVPVDLRRSALAEGGAHDYHVPRDHRRGLDAVLAGGRVGGALLVVAELQAHDAVLSEARDAGPGLRVERDQPIAGRRVEDPLLLAVAPVGEAPARELPGSGGAARP